MTNRVISAALLISLTTAAFAVAAEAAGAEPHARVSGDGGNALIFPDYNGGSGSNDLRVSVIAKGPDATSSYLVLADRVPIDIGKGAEACTYPNRSDRRTVRCVTSFDTQTEPVLDANLGGGNDSITVAKRGITTDVDGGAGNDTIAVSGFVELAHGGPGNDRISVSSPTRESDGVGGELGVYGDDGNDVITGSNYADKLYGGRGNDLIRGGKGADRIYGNSGNDTLYGNSGNDTISGGPGKDKISGGPGRNKITQ